MEVKSYGDFPVREYQGPVSYGLVTEKTYDFTANSGKLGNYARLTSVKYPSGNWERFTYETVGGKATGRIAKKVSAWKNNPFSSADNLNRVTLYTYDSNILDQRPRTVEEKIAGVTVSKTYYEYTVDTATGESLEIEEIAAAPTAAYGSAGNLRTVRRYYAPNAQGQLAGRLKCVTHPDLTCDTYTYDYGTFSAGTDFGAYTFTVNNTSGIVE